VLLRDGFAPHIRLAEPPPPPPPAPLSFGHETDRPAGPTRRISNIWRASERASARVAAAGIEVD